MVSIDKDADKRVKAMHLYLEAFDEGITDAAVNMLRVLTKIHFNLKVEEAEAKLAFNDRINYFIEICSHRSPMDYQTVPNHSI